MVEKIPNSKTIKMTSQLTKKRPQISRLGWLERYLRRISGNFVRMNLDKHSGKQQDKDVINITDAPISWWEPPV